MARNDAGNLAAATSTGGLTAKLPGRIGDTSVIGAGTCAENKCFAVSATGTGEVFIGYAAAREVAAGMRLGGQALRQATEDVVAGLARRGGDGGLNAVAADGSVALSFNCAGMYRGIIGPDGVARTAIDDGEPSAM